MQRPIPFGKYYLLDRINVGGMAEVFKAKAVGVEGFERMIAVKRILPNIAEDEEFITMFIDEAKIAVQLQHANIAQIFDLGKVDDAYFIALEYVNGKDLRAIFDKLRKHEDVMPLGQACFIIMQICEGLDYAHNKRDPQGHELNLVHRDVSPQNVLIGYDGEVKIVDFGIAKAAGKASKTQAGILKGKFGYMSPEQVRGLPVDRRSDIFSLGIVLYELLTGERLFQSESDFSTLEKVRNVEILPPSSFNKKIPPELERIVLKALAKDVDDRYQNAIDLHDDLQSFLYSVGEFCSRKDVSGWMKKHFANDAAEDNAKIEEYQHLDEFEEPTPIPPKSVPGLTPVRGSKVGSGSRPRSASVQAARPGASRKSSPKVSTMKKAEGLEWDDEELETSIFDKGPEELDDAELTSSDIELSETEDKTHAGAPPEEVEESLGFGPARAVRAPSRATSPVSRALSGPPPGLGAFRQNFPGGGDGGFGGGSPFDNGAPRTAFEPPKPNFRQTMQGVPPPQPYDDQFHTSPQVTASGGTYGRQRSRTPVYVVLAAALIAGGFGAYRYLTRPGKLVLMVKPADAQINLDGLPVKGSPPITLEKAPGPYHLSIERDGYVRRDENVEIQAGQIERREVDLEPSPDTGFELTSEPPGGLVWLDGQPFTSGDDNAQQARTNFKAYRVAPGRHVIEIKGDQRFEDWKQEFYQEPGKTLKLHAELKPRGSRPEPAPTVAIPQPAPQPAPRPVTVQTPRSRHSRSQEPAPPPRYAMPAPQPATPKESKDDEDVFEKLPPKRTSEKCSVTLGSKPWSEVYIDGRKAGVTPLVDYELPCGGHRISFRNPDLKLERNETVNLQAGTKFKKVVPLADDDQ